MHRSNYQAHQDNNRTFSGVVSAGRSVSSVQENAGARSRSSAHLSFTTGPPNSPDQSPSIPNSLRYEGAAYRCPHTPSEFAMSPSQFQPARIPSASSVISASHQPVHRQFLSLSHSDVPLRPPSQAFPSQASHPKTSSSRHSVTGVPNQFQEVPWEYASIPFWPYREGESPRTTVSMHRECLPAGSASALRRSPYNPYPIQRPQILRSCELPSFPTGVRRHMQSADTRLGMEETSRSEPGERWDHGMALKDTYFQVFVIHSCPERGSFTRRARR